MWCATFVNITLIHESMKNHKLEHEEKQKSGAASMCFVMCKAQKCLSPSQSFSFFFCGMRMIPIYASTSVLYIAWGWVLPESPRCPQCSAWPRAGAHSTLSLWPLASRLGWPRLLLHALWSQAGYLCELGRLFSWGGRPTISKPRRLARLLTSQGLSFIIYKRK